MHHFGMRQLFSSKNETKALMENSTTTVEYEWEYYYDYVDPVIVDETKLKYNKYLIVIILWIILAAFVLFMFLSLNLMSRGGNLPRTNKSKTKGSQRTSITGPDTEYE